ncbi:MAG: hypothetical protein ACRDL7_00325 [Gaiellaceae bacterium]
MKVILSPGSSARSCSHAIEFVHFTFEPVDKRSKVAWDFKPQAFIKTLVSILSYAEKESEDESNPFFGLDVKNWHSIIMSLYDCRVRQVRRGDNVQRLDLKTNTYHFNTLGGYVAVPVETSNVFVVATGEIENFLKCVKKIVSYKNIFGPVYKKFLAGRLQEKFTDESGLYETFASFDVEYEVLDQLADAYLDDDLEGIMEGMFPNVDWRSSANLMNFVRNPLRQPNCTP